MLSSKEKEDFQENPVEFLKIEFEEYDMSSNKYFSINLLQIINNNYNQNTILAWFYDTNFKTIVY